MSEKKNGVFQDSEGNLSSKRIAGFAMISAAGVFLLALGVISIYKSVQDPSTALDAAKTLVYAGGALLGVGTFEGKVKK